MLLFTIFASLAVLRLHDVVHQVVDVLIIHLLFRVVIDFLLRLALAGLLALVVRSFLLSAALMHPICRVEVILRAILSQAATITLCIAPLHLPLMIFELYAVLENLFACRNVVIRVSLLASFSIGALSCVVAAHLLLLLGLLSLLLLLALELLLLLHEVGARVLVQIELQRHVLVEVVVGFGDHRVAVRLYLFNLVQVLLQGLA